MKITHPRSPQWAALLALSFLLPQAMAQKGKPGGPTPPPPFRYQVTWIGDTTEANRASYYQMHDVAPDGTAVGRFTPGGVYGQNRAIVRWPDGTVVNLEDALFTASLVPSTWRVTLAYRISQGNVIALDVYDDAGGLHTGALKLDSITRSIEWFQLADGPDGTDALVTDVSEAGNFFIATGEFTSGLGSGIQTNGPANFHVWNPASDTIQPWTAPVDGGGWSNSSISDFPGVLVKGQIFDHSGSPLSTLPDPGTQVTPFDLGDNGTVVARIAGTLTRQNKQNPDTIARFVPGTSQWETIVPNAGTFTSARINAEGAIAGSYSGNLFVFHDTHGLLLIDNLIDTAQAPAWNASDIVEFSALSDSSTSLPGKGRIVGRNIKTGSSFILTPVAP